MRQRLDDESGARPDVAEPTRPEPSTPLAERLREWIDWFGLTRLVTSAVAVVVVCAGAWLLVRTPPPPSEASLPVAAATGASTPVATLPVASIDPDPPVTTAAGPSIVHVAGAVLAPGVYELGSGSRVDDAVRRAGGPTGTADLGRINLASPVRDGDQIYVPEAGEVIPIPVLPPSASDAEPVPSGPVDVNHASAEQLETLPGVGPATAAAIIAERDLNGPFASFDDLERVPGIGPAKLAGLAGLVIT